jgi:hypothetical protein
MLPKRSGYGLLNELGNRMQKARPRHWGDLHWGDFLRCVNDKDCGAGGRKKSKIKQKAAGNLLRQPVPNKVTRRQTW